MRPTGLMSSTVLKLFSNSDENQALCGEDEEGRGGVIEEQHSFIHPIIDHRALSVSPNPHFLMVCAGLVRPCEEGQEAAKCPLYGASNAVADLQAWPSRCLELCVRLAV